MLRNPPATDVWGESVLSSRRSTARHNRTLVAAFVAAGAISVCQVSAQEPLPDLAQLAQASRTTNFSIPAQPLAQALTALGQQAGIQVAVSAPAVSGKTSTPVSGVMTAEQALQILLSGTGVAYRFTSPTMVTIASGPSASGLTLDPVQVQGSAVPSQAMIDNLPPPYAGGQVATGGQLGLLRNRDVMDTPFNQTNYTAQKAQDQQAKTVREVLIDDPSIRATGSAIGGGAAETVNIRGFSAGGISTYSYGGLYGVLPAWSVMAELAERVEVLKGPSAMLNGMQPDGGIGGTINVVPKRAPDNPLTQFTGTYLSSSQFGGHADVARRFGDDKQFGVRFNGVFLDGATDVRWNSEQRALGILGLDFRGQRARFSADFGYQYQSTNGVVGYLGVANGVPLPWAPSARNNAAGQPWSNLERKDLFGALRGEFDLTDHITAYVAFGAHDSRVGILQSTGITITNLNGAATAAAPYNYSRYDTFRTAEAGLRALADTGPIGHELALTATMYEVEGGTGVARSAAYATNVYNPTIIARPNIATPAANRTSVSSLTSFGVADTLSAANKRLQLTLGARLQRVGTINYSAVTGASTSSYEESALSPSVALVFRPWQNVSVYGNWIQGLQPGAIVPANFANAGEVFPPYKSNQFEVGVKVDWGKFTTTASVFQITQPSILANVATNTQYLGGEQRNRGLELNVFGEPIEGVRLLGGAMFLDAVLTKTLGGLTDGWTAPSAPAVQLNLSGEWDLPFLRGATLTGRMVYTSSQYFDTTFPRRSLPDWTRFDLGARYAFENPGSKGNSIVARLNIENLLDANYWQGGDNATVLFLGAPRTFRLSLTADF